MFAAPKRQHGVFVCSLFFYVFVFVYAHAPISLFLIVFVLALVFLDRGGEEKRKGRIVGH